MAAKTSIQWSQYSWNPTRGCQRCSPGCEKCYAEGVAYRFSGPGLPYEGLVTLGKHGPRWNGEGRFVPDALDVPLHWKNPRLIFVNSMSDLFFERFTFDEIAAIFGIMATCYWHTFQVLTKRVGRAAEWFAWVKRQAATVNGPGRSMSEAAFCLAMAQRACPDRKLAQNVEQTCAQPWPLPNVWIGASVEDQKRADERLPILANLPAAIRFVSYEPALEFVDFGKWLQIPETECPKAADGAHCDHWFDETDPCCRCGDNAKGLSWLIIGGESGSGARPFDLAWARRVVAECVAAGVPVFVKQLGCVRVDSVNPDSLRYITAKKGDEPSDWPPELRRQEFPEQPQT